MIIMVIISSMVLNRSSLFMIKIPVICKFINNLFLLRLKSSMLLCDEDLQISVSSLLNNVKNEAGCANPPISGSFSVPEEVQAEIEDADPPIFETDA